MFAENKYIVNKITSYLEVFGDTQYYKLNSQMSQS